MYFHGVICQNPAYIFAHPLLHGAALAAAKKTRYTEKSIKHKAIRYA